MEARLSEKDRELMAVGASVAAGCVPCTQYHVQAVRRTPASIEEIMRAVDTALWVRTRARAVMAQVAYEAMGLPVPAEPPLGALDSDRMTHLVSMAAAVAANCPAIFQSQAEAGRAAGVSAHDIRIAVALAQMVRAKATEKMDACAQPAAADAPAQPSCACSCPS